MNIFICSFNKKLRKTENMREEKMEKKYTGCLLGAAIGDALGMQTEGLTRKQISKHPVKDYGRAPENHPNHKLLPGQYTDDTEQLIILSKSIIEARGFNPETFSKKLKEWGKTLITNPELNRLVGPTSIQALKNLLEGADWRDSGVKADSCGSAMRAAPVGLLSSNLEEVVRLARLSSCPTHTSSESIAGAVAVALAVSMSLQAYPVKEMCLEIASRVKKIDAPLGDKLEILAKSQPYLLEEDEFFGEPGVSNSVYETVPAAFFCFMKYAESFEEAVIAAANAGGDTDSVACMTGAVLGARLGIDAIPKRWIEGLERREYIESLSVELFRLSLKRVGIGRGGV